MTMTNESNDHSAELRRIVRMLEKTASMAEHASLTGSMGGGKDVAVRSYNSVLEHLANMGEIPAGLFPSLDADANLDSVGIASAQLAEYLREGLPESPSQPGKGPALVGGDSVIISLGGLGDIAEMVREHLPEWLRGKRSQPEQGSTERREGSESAAATTPPPASAHGNGDPPSVHRLSLPQQQVRIEELRPGRQEQTPR
jgi:hypothetical protein